MAALSLLECLAEVPDPRSRHGRRHLLTAILALVVGGGIRAGSLVYARSPRECWGVEEGEVFQVRAAEESVGRK